MPQKVSFLYCELRHALRETERLIVCGYGFGDKGINGQIGEWVASSAQNVMVVVDPKPESFNRRARPHIFFDWDRLLQSNRLVLVRSWIQDTSWKDIKDAIKK